MKRVRGVAIFLVFLALAITIFEYSRIQSRGGSSINLKPHQTEFKNQRWLNKASFELSSTNVKESIKKMNEMVAASSDRTLKREIHSNHGVYMFSLSKSGLDNLRGQLDKIGNIGAEVETVDTSLVNTNYENESANLASYEKDLAELKAFAKSELGMDDLEPWDIGWASEKLKQARYSFSDEEVKQYFPEPKVLGGLFKVIESLFNVKLKPDTAPVWHPDVRFFRIETAAGELVGQFYLDLYARETKRGGAWMDEAITRRATTAGIQTPVAYLNCNFPAPVGNKPATFSHDDVITLFHETGHGLHHLLTRVEELGVSGIHGVEWDAVELPSQFMENYCWEWEVLQGMTGHVDSGEPLPRALYDKMLAAKNFHSGLMTVRQLEFSLFDLRIHHGFDPKGEQTVLDVLNEVRREVAVLIPPAWHRFPNSFGHIFAGGYAAGYFSYKWAEVLSADAYAAFEEAGNPFDGATGKRFLDEILSVGGSRPAIDPFKAFRGREPSVDALSRHHGRTPA